MANIQLSKNLRYKRKQYNLTQEDISAKLNISRQAYSNYEDVMNLTEEMLRYVAQKVLGTTTVVYGDQ